MVCAARGEFFAVSSRSIEGLKLTRNANITCEVCHNDCGSHVCFQSNETPPPARGLLDQGFIGDTSRGHLLGISFVHKSKHTRFLLLFLILVILIRSCDILLSDINALNEDQPAPMLYNGIGLKY